MCGFDLQYFFQSPCEIIRNHYLSDNSGDNLLLFLKEFIDRHPTIENVYIYRQLIQ